MVQAKAAVEASADELKRFANLLLGIQHLVNSPLQIISTASDIIELKDKELSPTVSKIRNAVISVQRVT